MRKLSILAIVLAGGGVVALAQSRGIQWSSDPQQAVSAAQRTRIPIMVYVLAGTSERDQDIEGAQKRALADERVVNLAQRFVCLRLSRSRHREYLDQFKLPQHANMVMSFVSPDGADLGEIGAAGIGQVESLVTKMRLVLSFWNQKLFDQEIRPVLEKEDASVPDLRAALKRIQDFNITQADASLIKLLEREGLDAKIAGVTKDLLAQLSTSAAVNKLLDLSANGDKDATKALEDCNPAGAEIMLDKMITDNGVRYDIYKAVCRICRIKNFKSEKWWENIDKPVLKEKELKRVTDLVKETAAQWKKLNEGR